jgi:hypothetical protein
MPWRVSRLLQALRRAERGERVPIRRGNNTIAVMISRADLDLLERLEIEADIRAAEAARKDPGYADRISLAEFEEALRDDS